MLNIPIPNTYTHIILFIAASISQLHQIIFGATVFEMERG